MVFIFIYLLYVRSMSVLQVRDDFSEIDCISFLIVILGAAITKKNQMKF